MRNIIVREYLESLKEKDELDYIFPILLEAMDFKIISTPAQTKGLAQYGKDVIAIGQDRHDGIRKRFYFEVKGGADRDITTDVYFKKDGVRESIGEAKDRDYADASNPGFNDLPVKIVLVHNGTIHPSVKETFDGFIAKEFAKAPNTTGGITFEFERWDIYELSQLFADHLFGEYLLVDQEAIIRFKRVLVLIDTPGNDYSDFTKLIDTIINRAGEDVSTKPRKRLLLFETIRLVSFIVYLYAKEGKNLEIAKRCLPYAVLRLWGWIVKANLHTVAKVIEHYKKIVSLYKILLDQYFGETLPIAMLKDGLLSENGGRYEQIGYPLRSMDFLAHLIVYFHFQKQFDASGSKLLDDQIYLLIEVLNKNDGTTRPLFDNHSIPIALVLNFFIENDRLDDARKYLRNVIHSIQLSFSVHGRLPDGRNRIENIIQLVLRKTRSVYYEDQTSHLFGMIAEYLAVLDMGADYEKFREFISSCKVDLAIFEPFDDDQLKGFLPDEPSNHEANLFSHELFREGFQAEIRLELNFSEFRNKTKAKRQFFYEYEAVTAGLAPLIALAHVHFRTPCFPSYWRVLLN